MANGIDKKVDKVSEGTRIITGAAKKKALHRILTAVCEEYGLGACIHEPLMERNRYRAFVEPRQVGHYLSLTRLPDLTSHDVGDFWLRDHSTVLCSKATIEAQLADNRELRRRIKAVEERILALKYGGDRPTIDHYYTALHDGHGLAEWR